MTKTILLTIILFGLFLCYQLPLSAQSNLEDYLSLAIAHNANLQDFLYQQKISGLEVQKIKNQFKKPQWALTGDYLLAPYFANSGRVVALTSTPDNRAIGYDVGVSNGGLYSGQINVNYQLFTAKQSQPLVQQQELTQLGKSNQYKLSLAELNRQITADYLNVYLVQQQMDYVGEVKEQLIGQLAVIRKLTDRGLMRVTDLELLNLEIQNQAYQLNNLKGQYRQALQILNGDAGIIDTTLVRLAPVELLEKVAPQTSQYLEAYRLDSLAAANDQAVFETRYLPQINVFANGGLNAVELSNIYRKAGISAGIHFSWLLGDGGQSQINAQQNEIRQLNAQQHSKFANAQIQNNRLNNESLLQQTQQNIIELNSQLESYQKLLSSFRKEIALGQLSVIDYLNILRTYADLEQQKAQLATQALLIINEINYWNN